MTTAEGASDDAESPSTALLLTDLEVQYAQEIKEVVTGFDEYPNQSDFEYAQFALFARGNLERALFCIKGLQDFRDEYKITTDPSKSVEEGISLLRAFMKQQPWLVLDVQCNSESGENVLVLDFAQMNPSAIRLPEEWRTFLGGFYYLFQLIMPCCKSMREGPVVVAECQGFGWKNFSLDMHRQSFYHFHQFYPLRAKQTTWVHTSVISNLLHSFLKTVFPRDANKIQFVRDGIDGRLDEIFKAPCPEQAEARLLQKLHSALKERYDNQIKFALPIPLEAPDRESPDNVPQQGDNS